VTDYPHRLRLHGEPGIHAARQFVANQPGLITACGNLAIPSDERQPDNAQVTCTQTGCSTSSAATCGTCRQPIHWVDCPTGGWWRHDQHPTDGHDAEGPR
jgi:hypothetical protein